MIGKLSGTLDSLGETSAMIDVGGVGYVVFCSARTLRGLPRPGEPVRLLIETHVREDHIHLYGFLDRAEQRWFNLLQTVQGVGARVALAILSSLGPAELAQAIAAQDKAQITRADGVGAKLATRILTELKDKAGELPAGRAMLAESVAPAGTEASGGRAADAVSALVNLGYRRADAFAAVARAARELGGDAGLDRLIRAGLKELAR
ncbi:MAG: Holliday junction branch migration protein RuvA [Alphaproteobacteria bacterium]|nr:Holliday junction branch migration protein RuvA [Alphaproteobacteria bacterium]